MSSSGSVVRRTAFERTIRTKVAELAGRLLGTKLEKALSMRSPAPSLRLRQGKVAVQGSSEGAGTASVERRLLAKDHLYSAEQVGPSSSTLCRSHYLEGDRLPIRSPPDGTLGPAVRAASLALAGLSDDRRSRPEVQRLLERVDEYTSLDNYLDRGHRGR